MGVFLFNIEKVFLDHSKRGVFLFQLNIKRLYLGHSKRGVFLFRLNIKKALPGSKWEGVEVFLFWLNIKKVLPGSQWECGTTMTLSGCSFHCVALYVMGKPCFHTPPSRLSNGIVLNTSIICK